MATLLSLFDGSGGFPLAAAMCGITPIAASEVEPYPIAVTKSRFPTMRHLGDVSKIDGAKIEPVDIITFGSPCHPLAAQGHPPTVVCKCYDARGNGDGKTAATITGDHENRITDYTTIVCLQGNIVDRNAKQNGSGVCENVSHTLNAVDHHAVAYAMQGFGDCKESNAASGLKARDYKDATVLVVEQEPIILDRAFYNQGANAKYSPQLYTDGICPTLVARGPSAVQVRYIVRRLTPTECARLQGFPDFWGHPDKLEDMTDEDYAFWLEVRNTNAAINGKAVKQYTKAQMLKWYNGLHTDSAEYKMWGNGIALPCALYVMQGIEEVYHG